MTKEEYEPAVKAGLVDKKTQAAVENAIDTQMKEADVQALLEKNL